MVLITANIPVEREKEHCGVMAGQFHVAEESSLYSFHPISTYKSGRKDIISQSLLLLNHHGQGKQDGIDIYSSLLPQSAKGNSGISDTYVNLSSLILPVGGTDPPLGLCSKESTPRLRECHPLRDRR